MTPWFIGAGTALDWLVGDPPRPTHPAVVMGRVTSLLERLLWRAGPPVLQRLRGLGVTLLVVGGTLILSALVLRILGGGWLGDLVGLWLLGTTFAARNLYDHALAVERRLRAADLPAARVAVGRIVGRDTLALTAREVARAAVESVAENTGDGVLAPLFFAVLGAAVAPFGLTPLAAATVLALGYKAVNTLDSMLGYRSDRYLHFGWASARLDDLANFVPARLAPLVVALAAPLAGGNPWAALQTALRDGRNHPSPNSGLLEAAYAGALGFSLGGPTVYAGVRHERRAIGHERLPLDAEAIRKSRRLLLWTSLLGTVIACLAAWAVRR
jgi:adenosylcobinamide-phosphate synthase